MNREFHGVMSLLLVFAAVIIGVAAVFKASPPMGLLNILIILVSLPIIIYSFCSKCACRLDSCGHVLPGKLTRFLPAREPGPYTPRDIAGLLIPFVIIIGFPQWWLWGEKVLSAVFWILILAGIVEIRLAVCPACTNRECPFCPSRNRAG
jgi:hypothetical protein